MYVRGHATDWGCPYFMSQLDWAQGKKGHTLWPCDALSQQVARSIVDPNGLGKALYWALSGRCASTTWYIDPRKGVPSMLPCYGGACVVAQFFCCLLQVNFCMVLQTDLYELLVPERQTILCLPMKQSRQWRLPVTVNVRGSMESSMFPVPPISRANRRVHPGFFLLSQCINFMSIIFCKNMYNNEDMLFFQQLRYDWQGLEADFRLACGASWHPLFELVVRALSAVRRHCTFSLRRETKQSLLRWRHLAPSCSTAWDAGQLQVVRYSELSDRKSLAFVRPQLSRSSFAVIPQMPHRRNRLQMLQ